jgi:hypothetical protein
MLCFFENSGVYVGVLMTNTMRDELTQGVF